MSEKQVNEEMKQQAQSVTASAPSAEMMDDVQEIMKKYDRESNTREWIGVPGKIVRYREKTGGYTSVEQLLEIYRFDQEKLDGIRDLVTVSP